MEFHRAGSSPAVGGHMKKLLKATLAAVFALALSGAALAACDRGNGAGHVHSYENWTVQTPATCTEAGTEIGTCSCGATDTRPVAARGHLWKTETVKDANCLEDGISRKSCTREGCNESEDTPIPALGHDWTDSKVIREATCTEEGQKSARCKRCETFSESIPIPALGHKMVKDHIVKEADCEQTGEWAVKCSVCGEEGTEEIPALGHKWENGDVIEPAACEEEGLRKATCTRDGCGKEGEIPIPALGHKWGKSYTTDVEPTFESAGSRSLHCERCGKSDPASVQEIPKLDVNTPIEYEIRTLRTSGDLFSASGITISFWNAEGKMVATGSPTGGIYRAKLNPADYTVKIGCSNGYIAPADTVIHPENPRCALTFKAQLRTGNIPVAAKLTNGSVMYDFTATTSDGETFTLSDVLKTKKLVLINFWATWCGYCVEEFPGLERVWEQNQNDVAVLALSTEEKDSFDVINNFRKKYNLKFQFGSDEEKLYKRFSSNGVPLSVVIDCEGVIVAVLNGVQPEKVFRNYVEKYTSEPYWHAPTETSSISGKSPAAMLPSKRED